MKKIFFATLFIAALACNNSKDNDSLPDEDSLTMQSFSWQATLNDSTGKLEMKKNEGVAPDSLTASSIVAFINRSNPRIRLDWVRNSNDTVYLKIDDAEYLTQQMGSTGPTMYFANVIYNLTEIPGIKWVTVDFAEGDHASPGTYSRDDFKDQ
jgi:hypothetical protein